MEDCAAFSCNEISLWKVLVQKRKGGLHPLPCMLGGRFGCTIFHETNYPPKDFPRMQAEVLDAAQNKASRLQGFKASPRKIVVGESFSFLFMQ
jgi:hypothetical protein